MKKLLLLSAAAMAIGLAAPASAQWHDRDRDRDNCSEGRHGRCDDGYRNHGQWQRERMHRRNWERRAYRDEGRNWERRGYRDEGRNWGVGYRVPQSYSYYGYNGIPRDYARRYNLDPNYRYVRRNNQVYVVNPGTYAIERILRGW